MISRLLVLAGAVAGGMTSAQLPEFSQQYLQRLGGVVDGLGAVVAEFDASASAEGLTRAAALAQMTGTDFLERRQADMTLAFERHDRLSRELAVLQGAGPYQRSLRTLTRMDAEHARATISDFRPAVPTTAEGLLFALLGTVLGAGLMRGGMAILFRAPQGGLTPRA